MQIEHPAKDDEDVRLSMTIPGVGYYTALLVKAEIGDVNRFRNGEHLCGYAGIVLYQLFLIDFPCVLKEFAGFFKQVLSHH